VGGDKGKEKREKRALGLIFCLYLSCSHKTDILRFDNLFAIPGWYRFLSKGEHFFYSDAFLYVFL
jgi:hypothetical protein